METLIYITKSASILALFYSVYYLVLQKDTFFSTNRHYLIGGIIASLLLPLVVFTNTVYLDAPTSNTFISYNNITISETQLNVINWWKIVFVVYLAGILFMGLRFLKQLISVYRLISNNPYYKENGFRYIQLNDNINPFSFFKYIVYNPEKHTESELKMILKHEQTHAFQLHSIDIILSNIILIIQWMNPIAWLYKKSIEENLEFIADSETVQQIPSKKEYQLSMLKVINSNNLQPVLANNFYQSLIKKRIIMLHKSQSSKNKQWKLLLILPLLGMFLWSFNVEEEIKYNDSSSSELVENNKSENHLILENFPIEVTSKKENLKEERFINKGTGLSTISENKSPIALDNKITVTVDKNTTDEELENLKKMFKSNYKVTLDFTDIKRNSKGEITSIKVDMSSKDSNANFNQNDTNGIHEFMISYDQKKGAIEIGNFGTKHNHHKSSKENKYVYEIVEDENGNVSTWVSKDGHNLKKEKGKHYIIQEIHGDEGEELHEIKVISGSGGESNVWVTSDGNVHKKGSNTIIIDRVDDHDGEDHIFINSNGHDDEDSIFVIDSAESNIFLSGGKDSKPLIFIDGKKSNSKKMGKLRGDAIKKVEIVKGDEAIENYGEKAKDGVILITTKKN